MENANTISPAQLRAFFHPRSIALVGATDNSRWSIYTYQNLKTFGFAGPSTASTHVMKSCMGNRRSNA